MDYAPPTNENIAYIGLLADEEIELDSAALALSGLDHEGVDLEPYLDLLGQISATVSAESAAAGQDGSQSGEVQGALLSRVFGSRFDFAGDRSAYDAPLNADMIRVLDRRRGLPVSLSILYVAAARRMGWTAYPLNTPRHVLVSLGPDSDRAVIDPFNRGVLVQPDQLAALLGQTSNAVTSSGGLYLEPMSNRMTLVRLLLNQATRAEQAGDSWRACALYERMTIVAPEHGAGWWTLARLQLVHGEVDAARASLSAMLEITRDPERRSHIAATLERLAGQSSV
jgi:regulator of sirC expression with transglutaminase-like and TPR domain